MLLWLKNIGLLYYQRKPMQGIVPIIKLLEFPALFVNPPSLLNRVPTF